MATILDLIGSSVIMGLLLISILRVNMVGVDTQAFFTEDLITQTNLRNTVKIIEYDFRKIGYGATFDADGNLPLNDILVIADTNRIKFWAYLDADGTRDSVEYIFAGNDPSSNPHDKILRRRVVASGSSGLNCDYAISHGVTQFKLTYFGLKGDSIPTPVSLTNKPLVQIIQITISMESPYITQSQYDSDSVGYLKRSAMWRESRLVARNMTR